MSKRKILADVVEALIGITFLENGIAGVEYFFDKLLFSHQSCEPDVLRHWWATSYNFPVPTFPLSVNVEEMASRLKVVEQLLGYNFADVKLLVQAFVHPSFYSENKRPKASQGHYQILELFGDAILELSVSLYLFKMYPSATEGEMSVCRSQIVNNITLAKASKDLQLDKFLVHGSPHLTFEGPRRNKVCADLFESVIGAIFQDRFLVSGSIMDSLECCSSFIHAHLIAKTAVDPYTVIMDPKSVYQHFVQTQGKGIPLYKLVSTTNTLYGTIFEAGIFVKDVCVSCAEGQTVAESERKASENAIQLFLEIDRYLMIDDETDKETQAVEVCKSDMLQRSILKYNTLQKTINK